MTTAFLLKVFPNPFATSALGGFQITEQHQVGLYMWPPVPALRLADWVKMCPQRLDIPVTTVHFSALKAISQISPLPLVYQEESTDR